MCWVSEVSALYKCIRKCNTFSETSVIYKSVSETFDIYNVQKYNTNSVTSAKYRSVRKCNIELFTY